MYSWLQVYVVAICAVLGLKNGEFNQKSSTSYVQIFSFEMDLFYRCECFLFTQYIHIYIYIFSRWLTSGKYLIISRHVWFLFWKEMNSTNRMCVYINSWRCLCKHFAAVSPFTCSLPVASHLSPCPRSRWFGLLDAFSCAAGWQLVPSGGGADRELAKQSLQHRCGRGEWSSTSYEWAHNHFILASHRKEKNGWSACVYYPSSSWARIRPKNWQRVFVVE